MQFQSFNKIPRLNRDITVTEKINGSNAQVFICSLDHIQQCFAGDYQHSEEYATDFIKKYCLFQKDNLFVFAGSRNRWLEIGKDNFGFANWVKDNAEDLIKLGEGRHYGEWMGQGIQCNYGLDYKKLVLFNTKRWCKFGETPKVQSIDPKTKEEKLQDIAPKCCDVVPVLYEGIFDMNKVQECLDNLRQNGSKLVPGFSDPEGIVIYHHASKQLFKVTLKNDEKPKG